DDAHPRRQRAKDEVADARVVGEAWIEDLVAEEATPSVRTGEVTNRTCPAVPGVAPCNSDSRCDATTIERSKHVHRSRRQRGCRSRSGRIDPSRYGRTDQQRRDDDDLTELGSGPEV